MNQQKTEQELSEMGMYDAVFAELLNANQEIQIGTKVFKINTVDEIMIVKDVNAQRAETLSTTDSYFDIQDGLMVSGARGACAKENEPSTRSAAGSSGQVSSQVSYQRGGIYFSLVAKIKQSSRPVGRTISLYSPGGNTYTKNKSGASVETIDVESKNGGKGSYRYKAIKAVLF